jgi:hypothetical protein
MSERKYKLTNDDVLNDVLNDVLDDLAKASQATARKRKMARIGSVLVDVSKVVSAEETDSCTISLTFEDGTKRAIRTFNPSSELDKLGELMNG